MFCSGVFGRYLYGRLPLGEDGQPIRTQRLFAMWIILHRPIAAMMYILSFVHLVLARTGTPCTAVDGNHFLLNEVFVFPIVNTIPFPMGFFSPT